VKLLCNDKAIEKLRLGVTNEVCIEMIEFKRVMASTQEKKDGCGNNHGSIVFLCATASGEVEHAEQKERDVEAIDDGFACKANEGCDII
jgi:hypothetical protein